MAEIPSRVRGTDAADRPDPVDSRDGVATDEPIRITGFASGGEGVGRLADGRVVFVEGGIPGERVELQELRRHKKALRAQAGRVLDAGTDRVEPRCPHFGTCGGCRWQHVRYAAQLAAKRRIVLDALARIGGLPVESEDSVEIVASPEPYGYRARARWVASEAGIGYRVRGSRSVSPVEVCPVLLPSAEAALALRVSQRARATAEPATAGDATARRARPRTQEWVVTAGTEGPALVQESRAGRSARGRREKPGSIVIEAGGEILRVSGESFVQGNALLWDALSLAVVEESTTGLESLATARFVELYAGIGFFTLALARRFASGVALESGRSALADLAHNLRRAHLSDRVEVLSGRVETRGDLGARFAAAHVLLVDPPRIGLDAAVRETIGRHGPQRLVYVSCDPATLARDLRELGQTGYEIASLRLFDLFPQTPHVESLVRLERRSQR